MPRTFLTESPFGGSPHLFIATSAYSFHPNYTHSLAAGMQALAHAGIAADLCIVADNCHVDDARNAMVRQFLMSKATHLVFIDNDVGFPAESLVRLAKHDRDMVAGVYPLKEDDEGYPIRVKDGVELWADADGLVEVEGLPTGFLKISRACIEKMIDAYGDKKFIGRGQDPNDPPNYILFERTFDNGVRYSGDYAFCEKWKAIGGKMYVDPEMYFTHSGTKEWHGTLGNYWRKQYGVTEARFAEAIARMNSGRFDAETAAWLVEGWGNPFAASVNTLVSCWHSAKKARTILETGSGLSTLVLALANPRATVLSIESDPAYAAHTTEILAKYGIHNAAVICRLLKSYATGKWYDFKPSVDYDLVVLDGPNRQKGNRNVAFSVLAHRLSHATVLIDDAADSGLMAGFEEWALANGRSVVALGIKEKTCAISLPIQERKAA